MHTRTENSVLHFLIVEVLGALRIVREVSYASKSVIRFALDVEVLGALRIAREVSYDLSILKKLYDSDLQEKCHTTTVFSGLYDTSWLTPYCQRGCMKSVIRLAQKVKSMTLFIYSLGVKGLTRKVSYSPVFCHTSSTILATAKCHTLRFPP